MSNRVIAVPRKKLSASALNCFLTSPKQFYWRYKHHLEPLTLSMQSFDHDKICGSLWADFVDRFYKGMSEEENKRVMLAEWDERTHGWVSDRMHKSLADAMRMWADIYYQDYHPKDGCRNGSEKLVENDRFMGYIDGLSADETILHEVKSTSRAKQVSEQLWKVQNSLQVKLYCVLTGASGICIEFAYKDPPYAVYRATVVPVTDEQREGWEQELNSLADYIYSLGDDINNYPCHPDGCCITGKNFVRMCEYQTLCDLGLTNETQIAYKERQTNRK